MKKFFSVIFVLLLANFAFPQIQVNDASLTVTSSYGIEYDEPFNSYSSVNPQVGHGNGYDLYAVIVIDLNQLGGQVQSGVTGSITLSVDGNGSDQWTFGYLQDVVLTDSLSLQASTIRGISGGWTTSNELTSTFSSNQISNNKIVIGVLRPWYQSNGEYIEAGSQEPVVYFSGFITATVDRSVTLNVTYNQGSGNIVAYKGSTYNAPPAPAHVNGYEQDQITIGALSPTIPNYTLIYNENQAPLNKSAWYIYDQSYNRQTQTLTPSTNTFPMQYNQNNYTYEAQMKKLYNITFQNSFTGIGNGGTIIVNDTTYNSPTSPFNVVEQNSISGYPDDNYTNNGINYYFDHWSNGSTSASTTFYPGDHTTYTAYYKGIASKSNFNFGFDLLRGQPIKMHWTDNPNPNVSYQVWRTTNYSHGVAQDSTLIATVQKGVQSYTDNEYIFTGLSTDPAIYYDVKEYYSTEGTYSFPSWYTTKGELQPKIASSPNSKKSVESEIKEYSIACYPNPFNPTTTINYQLPKDGVVSIVVFDMLGNEVKTLVNGYRTAGSYNISFNASNLPSGIYFYRIQTNNYFAVKKMMLLK